MNTWELEVAGKKRFEFGRNWQQFLLTIDDERIRKAEQSLQDMLSVTSLHEKTFLDVGCGSGLFSLAAMRLGAERVHSLDYDPASVNCARELKRRYYSESSSWTIQRGDVLDREGLNLLQSWDVVYSWGVLHHTGNMWQALENVSTLVEPGGLLFISLYNDQRWLSKFWKQVKFLYNRSRVARFFIIALFAPIFVLRSFVVDLLHLKNPMSRYKNLDRGMSIWYDWLDWLGGYPFEVATPGAVVDFFRGAGYELKLEKTVGNRSGCNEFVFTRQT